MQWLNTMLPRSFTGNKHCMGVIEKYPNSRKKKNGHERKSQDLCKWIDFIAAS